MESNEIDRSAGEKRDIDESAGEKQRELGGKE
jgi:hypothetical protein